MTLNEVSRRELGSFLRSRRERIDPTTVGLPGGRRRRTAGLRREEVAILAGVSPTWYTYLEQGRSINPSVEVLDSLARVLKLSEDEWSYLHLLAYGQQTFGDDVRDEPRIEALIWQLVEAHDPHQPVFAANQIADILAWNTSAVEWFTDFGKLPEGRRNAVWWTFMDPLARERLVYWEEEARDVMGRLRAVSARRPGDTRLTSLVADLNDGSPDFRAWWKDHSISGQTPRLRWLRHPVHGIRAMNLMVAYPVGTEEIGIEFHLPRDADGDLADARVAGTEIHRLMSRPQTPAISG